MKRELFIIVVLFFCSLVNGQEIQYSGRVIDAKYHTPVPYAAVYIHSTNHGAVANNVGEFSFNAPNTLNNLQLVVAKDGYKIIYINSNNLITSDLVIELQLDDSEERAKMLEDSLAGKSGGFNDFINKATVFVKDDWIPLGNPETNKLDFGRIQTLPTYNPIEGVRLRA
ncbi:MAG TPA: carboxypeptidase-like regulatory domain-containing protein, partial [Fermentimonas sp.]|nr:carboxypeptidase-like regulatory domain-containing protein [Fermentimonas sp.]